MIRKITIFATLLSVVGLQGCMTDPPKAYDVNQPKQAPVRNLTNMDKAISCLDDLLVNYRVQPIVLTSTGLPNRAGDKVGLTSGLDMLKTIMGQLSRSNVFHYIDVASLLQSGNYGAEAGYRPLDLDGIDRWIKFNIDHAQSSTDTIEFPDYIIDGAISQLDGNTLSDQAGGSLGSDKIGNVGVNQDQLVSIVTVDMHVLRSKSLALMPGLTTKNSLAIVKGGVGMDLSGRIKTVGGYFNVSYDKSEGLHQGIRDLIELGTIELLGRLAKVPYQQCLADPNNIPQAAVADSETYENMSESERVHHVQHRLSGLTDSSSLNYISYYQGQMTGELDQPTREAIARYQRQAGLIANGEINLELFRSLKNPPMKAQKPPLAELKAPHVKFFLESNPVPVNDLRFALNSVFSIGLSATSDAYAHCFLQNQNQEIYRVFPTTEQKNDHLQARQPVVIPASQTTQVRLNEPGAFELGCVVSTTPLEAIAKLPLTYLGTPIADIDSVQQAYEHYQRNAGGALLSLDVFQFEVVK
jgi:hypothetical protein